MDFRLIETWTPAPESKTTSSSVCLLEILYSRERAKEQMQNDIEKGGLMNGPDVFMLTQNHKQLAVLYFPLHFTGGKDAEPMIELSWVEKHYPHALVSAKNFTFSWLHKQVQTALKVTLERPHVTRDQDFSLFV